MSPITDEIKEGFRIDMRAKCTDDSEEVDLFVQLERTTIGSVATSMFTYALDIGGEPHPIQSPKLEKQEIITEARIPVHGSLVLRGPDQPGRNHLTILRCVFVIETPEVAEQFAEARKRGFALPSVRRDEADAKLARRNQAVAAKRDRVANVYVDCGFDFTQAQIDEIAGQPERFGLDSVQVRDGRLHVLAQDLAHAQAAAIRFAVGDRQIGPVIRGGENPAGKKINYRVLMAALASLEISSCQLKGHIDYTIDREWIELRASSMELVYGAAETTFRMRADEGVIRVSTSGGDLEMRFESNVVITSGDMDGKTPVVSADKLFIDIEHEFESIEEIIAEFNLDTTDIPGKSRVLGERHQRS